MPISKSLWRGIQTNIGKGVGALFCRQTFLRNKRGTSQHQQHSHAWIDASYSGQPVAAVILKQQHFLKVSIKFYSLTISLHDIQLPLTLLEQVNKSLHLNCQFDILNIDLVQVTLLPRIRVLVSGFQMRAYSKPPNDWNQEELENALASNRLEIIDSLTSAINSKLKSNSVDFSMALLHVPMLCVDILIATPSSTFVTLLSLCLVIETVSRRHSEWFRFSGKLPCLVLQVSPC
jgi:hypothetical protein